MVRCTVVSTQNAILQKLDTGVVSIYMYVLCVSHVLRLPKKIFVKIFRAVHRWKAERETVPSV